MWQLSCCHWVLLILWCNIELQVVMERSMIPVNWKGLVMETALGEKIGTRVLEAILMPLESLLGVKLTLSRKG